MSATILIGDCRELLPTLTAGSVQCCVTSPPYWALRDYGIDGQIGLEATVEAFVAELVSVFAEVRRVLADDGTLWLNLGDTYAGSPGQYQGDFNERYYGRPSIDSKIAKARGYVRPRTNKSPLELQAKQLIGIPWRVALALQADGWILRQDIIWHKTNAMPSSVRDRCTTAHEYVFLLSKSGKYFYDADAIAEPAIQRHRAAAVQRATRNKRSVWSIPTEALTDAHFAAFPEALVEPCILAGSREGDTILDPFAGSGTTLGVATRLGRNSVGIEINPDYVAMIERRTAQLALQEATS